MEFLTLGLFCLVIIASVLFNIALPYALLAGLVLFSLYACKKGFSLQALGKMIIDGMLTSKNIMIVFMLIGMLTALWRACGTIAIIICYAVEAIHPSIVILMAFLLNCLISFLTGTSFGTAATMGVIAMTLGQAMGADPSYLGGAILAGAFWGDRCSPVSTSALLVAALTGTNIFDNIKLMFKDGFVPLILSCLGYGVLSYLTPSNNQSISLEIIFAQELTLHWIALTPALLILLLSLCRVPVKKAMLASIMTASLVGIYLQHLTIGQLITICLEGFTAQNTSVGQLLNGGGIYSMLKVTAIIAISSSYAGIFKATGLLDKVQVKLVQLSKKITPFGSIILTSLLTSAISCNQTLASILTHQLCQELEPDGTKMALNLENSVITLAALIPWSIACAVPLAAINAPTSSIAFAFYLYILPLYIFWQKLPRS